MTPGRCWLSIGGCTFFSSRKSKSSGFFPSASFEKVGGTCAAGILAAVMIYTLRLQINRFYSDAIEWLNKGLSINKDSEYAHDRLASALKDKEKEQEEFRSACEEGV